MTPYPGSVTPSFLPAPRVGRRAVSPVPRLTISLLGPPQVHSGGSAVRLHRRRTTALLAYLAVQPGPHRRESLLALLWPECGPNHAPAYLRNALWELGRSPVGRWLDTGNDTVELRTGEAIGVDIVTFRALLARWDSGNDEELAESGVQALTSAVELYRGHFLAGFTLPDSLPFDEWQESQAEALRQQLGAALERLVHHHLARGEVAVAAGLGSRWVALDPLDEPVYLKLMAIYSEAGHPDRALRQFELCARSLRDELQAQPSPETRALHEHIRGSLANRCIVNTASTPASHNLPIPSTPFVGRERELAEAARLLTAPECRVLTLVGYGGSGKTRLAVEAAAQWHRSTGCQVVFVSLAEAHSPLDAVAAILDALSLRLLVRGMDRSECRADDLPGLLDRLVLCLQGANGLLLLDNAEHLDGLDTIIHTLLDSNVTLRLLITSRRRLGLRAEWILPVEGLAFPEAQCPAGEWGAYPAIRLFIDTARRISHEFAPDEHELRAVRRVCTLLEGAPLAIELAAAWIATLSCVEIAAELEGGLDFLASTGSDVPARQRSLRAAFEYSWALLVPQTQACFARLSVFRGSFTRRAAREIAGASTATLAMLNDRSLIHQVSPGRYDVHPVLRQFAVELLAENPVENAAALDRHALYFLREVARLAPQLETRLQRVASAALEADAQNIAAAWIRSAESGWTTEIGDAAFGLFHYHDMTSRVMEGAGLFRQAADALPSSVSSHGETLRAFLETCSGWFLRASDPMQGRAEMERSVRRLRRGPPSRFLGLSLALLGLEGVSQWPSRAERLLAQSAKAFQVIGDRWGMAVAFEGLSFAVVRRDAVASAEYASRSLAIRSELGDTWGISMALMALGTAARFRGEPAVAREHYERSLAARVEFAMDRIGIAQCMWNIAATALLEGNHEEAMQRFRDAAALSREVGDLGLAARCLISVVRAARAAGRVEDARRSLEESLALSATVGAREEQAGVLAEMAALALDNLEIAAAQQAAEHALALDRASPCALFAVARIELARGIRSKALRALGSALRSARARHVDSIIVDIALTLAEIRVSDHHPVDAITLARSVLGHHFCYPAPKARAEAVLRTLNVRDGAFRRQGTGDPPAPLIDVVSEVMARARRPSPRPAAADSPRVRLSALDTSIRRPSYRRSTQGREVLKLPAAM